MKLQIDQKPVEELLFKLRGNSAILGRNKNIETYYDVWKGDAKWLNYNVWYSGNTVQQARRLTMNPARYFCRSWANNFANENTTITVKDDVINAFVQKTFARNKFFGKFNNFTEMFMGLGAGATVINVNDKTKEEIIEFIGGRRVLPITIENGEITEAAFYSINNNKASIAIHLLDKETGFYNIYVIKGSADKGVAKYESGYELIETRSKYPLFVVWHPNVASEDDLDCAFGTSVFDSAMDALRQCDTNYTALYKEIELGKKKLMIRSSFVRLDENGKPQSLFDQADESIVVVPDDDNSAMSEFNGELRIQSILASLNANLNMAAMLCGLGQSTFEFESSGRPIQTATGVIAKQTELYRNVIKQENLATDEFRRLVIALVTAHNLNNAEQLLFHVLDENGKVIETRELEPEDIVVTFDDNIVEDTATAKDNDMKLVQLNLMSMVEFRCKYFGEDEVTAEKYLQENGLLIDKYLASYQSGALTTEQYVDLVFGKDCENHDAIVEELRSSGAIELPLDEDE